MSTKHPNGTASGINDDSRRTEAPVLSIEQLALRETAGDAVQEVAPCSRRVFGWLTLTALTGISVSRPGGAQTVVRQPQAAGAAQITSNLDIVGPGARSAERLDLDEALRKLHIPSVSLAFIENDRLAWANAYGDASPGTLYQAASISKFVTAVAALRLVQRGRLDLDRDINAYLVSWRIPESELTGGS